MRTNSESLPVWRDRARWFGLPVLFEWYELHGDRLAVRRGLLVVREDWVLLYRVLDVRVRRSLLDMLLGTGTVEVYAADATDPRLLLRGVRRPREVAAMIQEAAEAARAELGVRGRELFGAAAFLEDHNNSFGR
ncbi:PH domain-containing protein [Ammonifex thiophilus]|uniref:PH domain-containing protein n=1 Tax=Ammonifex thiophilus TaxID=444093 RepID=UPI001403DE52|nr:PH domain-containing protein [Ammonifex thiophilus]